MTVQMIGRDVEDDGDRGAEVYDSFQLEAGDFEHAPALRAASGNESGDRKADVSAYLRRLAAGVKNFSAQCSRGGFAVRPGNCQDAALQKTRRELQLTDDRSAEGAGLDQLRRGERNAGADDDEILAAEGEQAVAARPDLPRPTTRIFLPFNSIMDSFADAFCRDLIVTCSGWFRVMLKPGSQTRDAGAPIFYMQTPVN
jgi:hypothetical protein